MRQQNIHERSSVRPEGAKEARDEARDTGRNQTIRSLLSHCQESTIYPEGIRSH